MKQINFSEDLEAMKVQTIRGNVVDIINRRIYGAELFVCNGRILKIVETQQEEVGYILPGFIDAHVHIESSMLAPPAFAAAALRHGSLGAVCDPHEIANVLGIEGVYYMLRQSVDLPFYCWFGAPSCVPATPFESSGGSLDSFAVEELLKRDDIHFLSEMMNYPGVIMGDKEVMRKIKVAKAVEKPIDGHAPLLRGKDLANYIDNGISTEHEASTFEEGLEKCKMGMFIQIREGSAGRCFDALIPLFKMFPEQIMFCFDDAHPSLLCESHINGLVKRSIDLGYDFFDVLRAASYNPAKHYQIPLGFLQPGDSADFIMVSDLRKLDVEAAYWKGNCVYEKEGISFALPKVPLINNFHATPISTQNIQVKAEGKQMQVIVCEDGNLLTRSESLAVVEKDGYVVSDIENDILKIVVLSRYTNAVPAVAFIHGMGLKRGAVAQSIMHDSHNIIAVGASDEAIVRVINAVVNEKGGIAVVSETEEHVFPLPIAGIMSPLDIDAVDKKYRFIEEKIKDLGTPLHSLQMTLSFMGLLVIPSLKLSDKGLFNSELFSFTGLFEA